MTTTEFDLKHNKTEVIVVLSNTMSNHSSLSSVILEMTLSFLRPLVKCVYFELHHISSVSHLLSVDTTKTPASAFVVSRSDYRNSPLSGCSERLIEKVSKLRFKTRTQSS